MPPTARQRVAERHQLANRQAPGGLRGRCRLRPDAEPPGRPPQQDRVPGRIRRRDEQQPPGGSRESLDPPQEAVLDPA
jgi:hypothetical protein